MDEFKGIIERVIGSVIIPLLPFYIFGIFLSMTRSGQVAGVLGVFVKPDRGDLLHDRRAAARAVLRRRTRGAQKSAADAPHDACGLRHGSRNAVFGRHDPRDAGADHETRRAARNRVVRRAALRDDPPLRLDDEDRRLRAGRVDDRRTGACLPERSWDSSCCWP